MAEANAITQNSILTFIDYITTSIQNFAAKNIIKNRSSIYKFGTKKNYLFSRKIIQKLKHLSVN